MCAENDRCAPRTKLFPHAQERPQKLTTLPSADGFGRHKPIETSTQASTRSFTGGRPCDGTLQMLRRRKTDLCRVKRSCGGEGGKCSLAFLVSRGISWGEDGPKPRDTCTWTSAGHGAVVRQRIVWSESSSMTAPGLPPHLCHEQRVDDHCKKQHRRLHEKNKNGRPPATMAQG